MEKVPDEDKHNNDHGSHKHDHGSPPSTPRWVKISGVIGLLLILMFIIMHLTGHSPFMHKGMQMP